MDQKVDKFLQKVFYQDSIQTGARKHQKKSQEFGGGEIGENQYFVYRGRQHFKITINKLFFDFVGTIGGAK